jgi:hypothetical protein
MAGRSLLLGALLQLASVHARPSPVAEPQQSSCVIINVGTPAQYLTTVSGLYNGASGYTSTSGEAPARYPMCYPWSNILQAAMLSLAVRLAVLQLP